MGIQTASQAFTNEGGGGFSFRNKIINGAMEIDQRNAGTEVNPATHNGYQLDRWSTFMDVANKFKVQQLTSSPPSGFTTYMRLTVTNAYTSTSGERFGLNQKIEGYNLIDTDYGTATAKPLILSFWVRSSLTGTFGGSIHGETTTSTYYPFTYTISSANTWEKKTVSILPLTSYVPNSRTTGNGMRVWFDLGSYDTGTSGAWTTTFAPTGTGAQKWLSNASATLDFTGVQLELGNQATTFERRNYQTELSMCQRYCYVFAPTSGDTTLGSGAGYSTSAVNIQVSLPVAMRSYPSATGSGTWLYYAYGASSATFSGSAVVGDASNTSTNTYRLYIGGISGITAGGAYWCLVNNNTKLIFSSEL